MWQLTQVNVHRTDANLGHQPSTELHLTLYLQISDIT
jgi:hypothetical protein